MDRIIIPALFLLVFDLYILMAGPGRYELSGSFSADETVISWQPLTGSAIAVTHSAVVLADKRLPLAPTVSYKNPGPDNFGLQLHQGEETGFQWFDLQGNMIGEIREQWPFDIALPRFMIDNKNNHAVSTDILNRLRIFSPEGKPVSELQIFPEYEYHTENTLYTAFVEGKRNIFAVLTQVYPNSANLPGYRTKIRYFTLDGTTLFEDILEGWQINAIEVLHGGDLFAVSLYIYNAAEDRITFQVRIYDHTGVVTHEFDAYFRNLYDGGQDHLLLLNKDTAILYDLRKRGITGTYQQKDPDRILMTADYQSDDGHFIIEEGHLSQDEHGWNYKEIMLLSLDQGGNITDITSLDDLMVYQPVLRYDPKTRQLFVGHSSGWINYRVNNQ